MIPAGTILTTPPLACVEYKMSEYELKDAEGKFIKAQ